MRMMRVAMVSRTGTYVAGLLCGVVLALAFPGWHLYPLAWIALVPVFYIAHKRGALHAGALFFVTGWAFYSVLLQWLITNIYWAGGWAVLGYQLLCVYLALYWAAFGLVWRWAHKRSPVVCGAVAAALLWTTTEYLQGSLLTGFGWGWLGYSQGANAMAAQLASIGGVLLVSTLIVLFNALVGLLLAENRVRAVRAIGAVAVLAIGHGIGAYLIEEAQYKDEPERLDVGIVQANFPLEMKWDDEYETEMVRKAAEKSRFLAQHEPVDLFVWPETLIMTSLNDSPEIRRELAELTSGTECFLFTGIHRVDEKSGRARNSSAVIDETGTVAGFYDKVHLAPFGEYVPLRGWLPFVDKVVPSAGDIEHGDELKTFDINGKTMGALICFEVLFGDLSWTLRDKGADFLAVITNLGWFGRSNAIPQELEIARFRAIETRLPVVHCANTGISGVFDPWGRFDVVNGVFDDAGRYYKYQDLDPVDIRMMRCAASLPVAEPGGQPVPAAPKFYGIAACALGVLFLILSAAIPSRSAEDDKIFTKK